MENKNNNKENENVEGKKDDKKKLSKEERIAARSQQANKVSSCDTPISGTFFIWQTLIV